MKSSWVIRKIIGAREHLKEMRNGKMWIQKIDFSVKELYIAFMGQSQRVPWAKMVCQNAAPPKYLFITWFLLHGKLATCSYLQKVGVQVDPVCYICEQENETLEHLFFECIVARDVWNGVSRWCGIDREVGD